jgi:branched-chain amino acid transport system permease protein
MATPRAHATYWAWFSVILILLIVAPLVLPEFWRRFVTEILIWGLLAMSSDILIGYTGMVSFGHSAFFGLGMYGAAAALLTVKPANLWLALLAGLVAAAVVGAFVAFFATRLREIYFSITTLVFSQIFYVIIFTWTEVTGGENGLTFSQPAFRIPGLVDFRFTHASLHWFVLAVVVLSYLLLRRITQSPFGMVLQSIKENEPRTRAIGYHVERYKIVAVMLSGLFAGLAGVLYALQNKFAAPDFVFFVVSGEVVIFNVMGGMGTLVGPIAGAAFFLVLREVVSRYLIEYYLIPVGIIFTAMVIFLPQGLLGFLKRRLNPERSRPSAGVAAVDGPGARPQSLMTPHAARMGAIARAGRPSAPAAGWEWWRSGLLVWPARARRPPPCRPPRAAVSISARHLRLRQPRAGRAPGLERRVRELLPGARARREPVLPLRVLRARPPERVRRRIRPSRPPGPRPAALGAAGGGGRASGHSRYADLRSFSAARGSSRRPSARTFSA